MNASAPPRKSSPALFALEHATRLSAAPVRVDRGESSAPTAYMPGNEEARDQARALQRLQGGAAAHLRVTEDLVRWRESRGAELEQSVEGLHRSLEDLAARPTPAVDAELATWQPVVDARVRTVELGVVALVAGLVVSHLVLGLLVVAGVAAVLVSG